VTGRARVNRVRREAHFWRTVYHIGGARWAVRMFFNREFRAGHREAEERYEEAAR
jgi:hypothetical protein